LANLYTKKKLWQQAIDCYSQAIAINPQYPRAHLNLARVFARLGKQPEFIAQMQIALVLKPDLVSATDCFNLGNALVKQGKQRSAIDSYEQAIAINPNFLPTYYRLGELFNERERHQEAIEVYEQALKFYPNNADIYYLLGQQLGILQQWDKAVRAYSKVLQLQPKFPQAPRKLNHALAEKLRVDLETRRRNK
jgi:tetratricopeptide (TPR) repeat protein